MEQVTAWKAHGGLQGVYCHTSRETKTAMTFAVFVPEHAPGERLPVLWYFSGLTCTHANVMEKGEYRQACAQHLVIFVAPDTSPRGEGVPDAKGYDFGQGAGSTSMPRNGRGQRISACAAMSKPSCQL